MTLETGFFPIFALALLYIGWQLKDISIELKYRNSLAEKQKEILEKEKK